MMAKVNQYFGLGSRQSRQLQRHTPIRNIRVIEGRFERLVLNQQPLIGLQRRMDLAEDLFHPADALADILSSGDSRGIGKPRGYVLGSKLPGNFHTVEEM